MTVTLADVAARAQVSPATVSRVLNGNYPVAASTRERVLRAVDELDYVLNGPASALAAATSDLVGILVNDIADPFFGIMASAIQSEIGGRRAAGPGGERLAVVCNTGGSPERELTYLTLLQRQRAAAVVLTGGAVEDAPHAAAVRAKLRQARRRGHPGGAVRTAARDRTPRAIAARPSTTAGGGRRLTEHLIGLGHRRLGYIAGPEERTTTRHRLEGHRRGARPRQGGIEEDRALRRCTAATTARRLRGDPGTAAPRPVADGGRRRQRHGRARGVRGAARAGACGSRRTCRWRASTTCRSASTPSPRSPRCGCRWRRRGPGPGGSRWAGRSRRPAGWPRSPPS